ncbi:hypothetical protein [Amycolatopsis sp. lyj-90]|uniref:hypothetical protein n=1 Tax=Amycolatopsis sp. lyj-90 TaxID=2789285 RepID=UPI00397AEEE9
MVIKELPQPETGPLTLEYREGRPVLIVSGGSPIPERIEVEDSDGRPVGAYTAGEPASAPRIAPNYLTNVVHPLFTHPE